MNFQKTIAVLVQLLKLIDKYDEPAREILYLVSKLLPEKYSMAIGWILAYEPKVLSFFLDLTGQSEARGGSGKEKLANALYLAVEKPVKPDKDKYNFTDMIGESVNLVNAFIK